MAKASDNLFPYVHLVPAATPASPAAGSQRLFLDSADGNKLKRKDSSGTVTSVEAVAGGGSGGLKDYASVRLTTGDLSLASTSITEVAAGLSLTLTAAAGDIVEYGISGRLSAVAQYVALDVYTYVSAARVAAFGDGLSASLSGASGVQGWFSPNVASERYLTGAAPPRTLDAGDISGGNVNLRLFYAKNTTTARTLYASSGLSLTVWAKNFGPSLNP